MTDELPQGEVPAEAAPPVTQPVTENAEPAPAPDGADKKPEAEGVPELEHQKPKGGFQRRIDELTRNWREAERRNDELMAIVKSSVEKPEAKAPDGPPTLEQHGYDEGKYQAALTDYVRTLTQTEARAVIQQEQAKVKAEARAQTFKKLEADFAATVEDYADKVYDPSLPLSQTVVELIQDSEIGPRVAYYLADNPDLARSLQAMSPTQAAREFGKLEAKLAIAPVAAKPVTKAPPPPPQIAAQEPEVEKDPDQMSTKEWLKWREKQLRKKR